MSTTREEIKIAAVNAGMALAQKVCTMRERNAEAPIERYELAALLAIAWTNGYDAAVKKTAAPELLAALNELLTAAHKVIIDSNEFTTLSDYAEAGRKAHAAIKKATS